MEKDNKYYSVIENLIKNHKKYNGYEAILTDIIDDVFKHSKSVLGTVNDEDVILSYLNKIVNISIITVPKRLNFHSEIKHRTISTEITDTPKQPDISTELQINETKTDIQEEEKISYAPKANIEFVDRMINSIDSASVLENNQTETQSDDDTVFFEDLQIPKEPIDIETDSKNTFTEEEESFADNITTETLGPVAEEFAADEPVDLEPASEEVFAADEPVDLKPASEEVFAADEPVDLKPASEEVFATDEPVVLETASEEVFATDEPVVLETASEEVFATDEPVVLEPASEEVFATDEPVDLDPASEEEFATDEPVDFEPASEEVFATDEPVDFEPASEEVFATDEPVDFEPASEEEFATDDTVDLDPASEEVFATDEPVDFEPLTETETDNLELISEDIFTDEEQETLAPEWEDSNEIMLQDVDNNVELNILQEENPDNKLDVLSFEDNSFGLQDNENIQNFEVIDNNEEDSVNQNYSFDDSNNYINLTEENSSDTTEFKPVDYSMFNFAPSVQNEDIDIQDIENKLVELNNQEPDLFILKVFDLKYKQDLPIAKIAEVLDIDKQTVISALDKIIELI